jgi:hypothetical protein
MVVFAIFERSKTNYAGGLLMIDHAIGDRF